ncbi:MAG: hypothetical protein LBI67_04490 [Treponema sp.]|jgi:hypothetical protein|nr:hypothetical protein [Treponema sp.]
MQAQNVIDFKKMDWSKVDREKAEFFYNEATDHNDRLLESINNLNSKAFSLLAIALSILSATAGFLLSIWNEADKRPIAVILLFASFCLTAAVILLLLAVFPRSIYLSKGKPSSYFTGDFYKADMPHLFSFGIASLNTYIQHNQKIENRRSRFLVAGTVAFIATPIVTIAVFLIRLLNW